MIRILPAVASAAVFAMILNPEIGASASSSLGRQIAGVPTMPLRDLGRAPAAMPMHLAVVLPYQHESELETFVARAAFAPKGVARALTADQFRTYFAPTADAYSRVAARLKAHGLALSQVYTNRTLIDVTAPVAAVERTFDTEIHRVVGADGTPRFANVRPAYLPADLGAEVYGIAGFGSVNVTARSTTSRPAVAEHPPFNGPSSGFGPAVFARAYDMPVQHQISGRPPGTTYDGRGVRVAIIANDDFHDADLTTYLRTFGIVRTGSDTHRIPIDGGAEINGIFSDVTTLQVEALVGTSPGIGLYDYGIPELSGLGLLDAMNQIDADDKVSVALSPAFDCETGGTPSYEARLSEYLALQGNALGIVYVVDTGDPNNGGTCVGGQLTPAGDPHMIAVGATTLLVDRQAQYKGELAYSYSVGGPSAIFPLPSYQTGLPNVTQKHRVIPDVAFDGDPGSGADEYFQRYWEGPEGGSELSAAIFTSLAAQLTQVHGAALGDLHPVLYGALQTYGYATPAGVPLFHDITIDDGFDYRARSGFDLATGIGSIDGWNFAQTANL
jgi:subtilase family serine protease